MNDPKSQQEPSMEEILASIRRIISEDDAEGEEGAGEATPVEAREEPQLEDPPIEDPEPEPEDDVLDLTEAIEEDVEEESADESNDYDMALSDDSEIVEVMDDDEPAFEPDPTDLIAEAPVEPAAPVAAVRSLDDGLISPPPAGEATSQFSVLAAAVAGERMGQSMGVGARTIEDLVKEVMRPMIKEWLDENLPALVERLVGREIDRMARRAEDEVGD
jgi:cell pole-organizing protein PopZ